jgi:hypothetical protein
LAQAYTFAKSLCLLARLPSGQAQNTRHLKCNGVWQGCYGSMGKYKIIVCANLFSLAEPGRKVGMCWKTLSGKTFTPLKKPTLTRWKKCFLIRAKHGLTMKKNTKLFFRVTLRQSDRDDYAKFLTEYDFDEATVRAISENDNGSD